MSTIAEAVRPGIYPTELDNLARQLIKNAGDQPAFLNYRPHGAKRAFPAVLCVSINEAIVHGIPTETDQPLRDGMIVALDLGLIHRGLITDMAITVPVGEVDEPGRRLIEATKQALVVGIAAALPGGTIGDIGAAIQSFVRTTGFSLAKGLAGHGVGYAVHEDPYVPNEGRRGTGEKLEVGMVLAIEPMLCEGRGDIFLSQDGFTYLTRDGKRSAHFEHTIVIGENGAEILTRC